MLEIVPEEFSGTGGGEQTADAHEQVAASERAHGRRRMAVFWLPRVWQCFIAGES
jgi:hypothetical protein